MTKLRAAALALLMCACTQAPAPEPQTIALAPLRERLRTVEVSAGDVTGTFLFDSAAGTSMVSPDFAARIGCSPRGRQVGFRMMGDRLDTPRCDDLTLTAGGVALTPRSVGVLDLSPYLAPGQTPQDGVLGLDAFAGGVVTIDAAHNALIVETPASFAARIDDMVEVPARISREVQGAALAVNIGVPTPHDGVAWFELDTGNGGTVLVSKHLAAAFGLDPDAQGPQTLHLPITSSIDFGTDRAFTPDMILDGNLGMPFLLENVVTIDLANERVWIGPAQASSSTSQ